MKYKKKLLFYMLFFFGLLFSCEKHAQAASLPIEDMKNAVVEVQTGIRLSDGSFHPVKSASGCIIENDSDGVYVVTTEHTSTLTEKEKRKFLKKNHMKTDDFSVTTAISLVIKGDVTTEAAVVADSKEYDFCLLSASDVLQEKSACSLSEIESVKVGDVIYALGFRQSLDAVPMLYDINDVEIREGTIQDTAAAIGGQQYIQHSSIIDSENSGGALLSQDGFLIGINDVAVTTNQPSVFYALQMDTIMEVLDNYGIAYHSKKEMDAVEQLTAEKEECERYMQKAEYTADSLKKLASLLEETDTILEQKKKEIDQIENHIMLLKLARNGLKRKMPKIRIVNIVAGILLGVLMLNLLRLGLWIKRKQKRELAVIGSDREYLGDYDTTMVLERSNRKHQAAERAGNTGFNSHYKGGLLSERSRMIIRLEQQKTIVGKSRDKANFVIDDNSAVSRQHACILWRDGKYRIKDLNSSNGTFVNGKRNDGTEVALENGDKIMFADEIYEFKEEV